MNSVKIKDAYNKRKEMYFNYINRIKSSMPVDIYSVINTTIVKNPFNHYFPLKFFLKDFTKENNIKIFFIYIFKFYFKQFYYYFTYVFSYCIFKFKNSQGNESKEYANYIGIDIPFFIDKILTRNEYKDDYYFLELYLILEKYNIKYVYIPRLYGISKNPFKLIKLLKVLQSDNKDYIFEFELLSIKDLLILFMMILKYPFKTLRLLQKVSLEEDYLFNNELIKNFDNIGLESFTRYLFGKNIASKKIKKIYSWSEFQGIERSFNYGIRTFNNKIELNGCQFFLNYDTYFNSFVDDLDFEQKTSYHNVFVNGKKYLLDRKKVKYLEGVSLRYKELFKYSNHNIHNQDNLKTLILGSYFLNETQYMLESVNNKNNIIFKNHPAVDIKNLNISQNINIMNENIYDLFKYSNLVISSASGTLIEAVACGLSAIIVASETNLTANPFSNYGKGEIWDIAFSKDDVTLVYNKLLKFRVNNIKKINEIALWYKQNYFIEPTEQNIMKVFEIGKDR